MASIPAVGSRWHRKPPARQVVTVTRVWYQQGRQAGRWTVQAAPSNEGPPVIMDADEFTLEAFRHLGRDHA